MAGALTISTLKDSSGVLATQNGMTGIAKAWVNFQGGNGNTAGTINGSFNVSSITVNAISDFTINFATAMPNANYAVSGTSRISDSNVAGVMRVITISSVPSSLASAMSTTFVRVNVTYANTSGALDVTQVVTVMVIGS